MKNEFEMVKPEENALKNTLKEHQIANDDNYNEINISTLKIPIEFLQDQTYTLVEETFKSCEVKPSIQSMRKTVKSLLD